MDLRRVNTLQVLRNQGIYNFRAKPDVATVAIVESTRVDRIKNGVEGGGRIVRASWVWRQAAVVGIRMPSGHRFALPIAAPAARRSANGIANQVARGRLRRFCAIPGQFRRAVRARSCLWSRFRVKRRPGTPGTTR